ncbi:metallophosphoesterase family protein [Phenylobacterium kunshanense]|uniref:Metallophosphoesterase n=1 Tax=Phenylobacterium kunshanense TaxID=1445034 RepID=A0A328BGI5_9CAUL|nr:metallophosphoesterase [Phenylobacterium kunshanense]RAK64984.1 metallophosphoesterase [Phenylobacterium kunshanense]
MKLRLAHLSDIHFGGENKAAVAAAGDRIRAGGFDLTVIAGDLTRYAEEAEFREAAAWLDGLPEPRLVTPGNHDAPYLAPLERIFAPFRRYERHVGPAPAQSWRGKGVAVRGVNTARGAQPRLDWSKGQIAEQQAREAAAWFEPGDALRIVVVHHPLVEMIGGPMTARVWGGERAAGVFADARVDLVLSGHIHAPFTWPYPHRDGRTYAVGSGTLSVRERGVPPSYNEIEVEDGCIRVTALAWTGSHYEPYRTWALDRRPG